MATERAQPKQDLIWWQGALFKVKGRAETTGGALGLIDADYYPGFATPVHVHHREDEAWYVMEGQLQVKIGDEELIAGAGDFVFAPREVPHCFKALDSGARALLLTVPGGLEEMFIEGGLPVTDPEEPPPRHFDIDRLRALTGKFGCDVVGPPMD